jgi:predicted DNA-binding protein
MAKSPKRRKDAHRSGFMVRLPESYRERMEELRRKTDRPYSAQVRRAMDAYLKLNGIEPPREDD